MEIILRAIGVIHSPFTEKELTPIPSVRSLSLPQFSGHN